MRNAKDYKNCNINQPVFSGDENTRILEIISSPKLHTMLVVVNKIMQYSFEKKTNEWTGVCNLQREVTHVSIGSEGNSCKLLLSKVDVLQKMCSSGCLR